MRSCLITVGSSAGRCLPAVLAALSLGAAHPFPSLALLCVPEKEADPALAEAVEDYHRCSRLLNPGGGEPFFVPAVALETWIPSFSGVNPGEEEASGLLLGALRGPGLPLSPRTDAEAVSWLCSAFLDQDSSSDAPLRAWLAPALSDPEGARILLLADLCDSWSAGVTLALLPRLRELLKDSGAFLGLLGLASVPGSSSREEMGRLRSLLERLESQPLIRTLEDRPTDGADALWLLGLPASLAVRPESARLLGVPAARILGECFDPGRVPSPGVHARALADVPVLSSLGDQAAGAAAFLKTAVWCLSDLFPSLHRYLEHPVLLRSLAPATRNGLFRRLFRPESNPDTLPEDLALLERSLKRILSETLALIRALPPEWRNRGDTLRDWQTAVTACGRAITLAAEYEVSRAEAAESGIDRVKPVHRDSLADTEEEKALRRLDEMADTLGSLKAERAAALTPMGGFRAWQALMDCLLKCRSALKTASAALEEPAEDTEAGRLKDGLRRRRVRLLEASVSIAEKDLLEATEWSRLSAPSRKSGSASWQNGLLSAAACEALSAYLSADQDSLDAAEKGLRDLLPDLLCEVHLADAKDLLRGLLAQPDQAAGNPLAELFLRAWRTCLDEWARARIVADHDLPELPLLPDVLCRDLPVSLSSVLAQWPLPASRSGAAALRGLLAFLMLRLYRRSASGEAVLKVRTLFPQEGTLLRVWLRSRHAGKVTVLLLDDGSRALPFLLVLPGELIPARLTASHAGLVPAFVTWFDSEACVFRDPCALLGETDRGVLISQLRRVVGGLSGPLSGFLEAFIRDLEQKPAPAASADGSLRVLLEAVCGLRPLPAYAGTLSRSVTVYERLLPQDPVASALLGKPVPAAAIGPDAEEIIYLYRGIPLARESSDALLESFRLPEEGHILSMLKADCDILSRSSDDYHDALARNLTLLLARYPKAAPGAVEAARSLLNQAGEPLSDSQASLSWPWDPSSPSVRTLLTECLGEKLARVALIPFSDLLTVFPARAGEIFGDSLLSSSCVIPSRSDPTELPEGAPPPAGDAVLPPLYPDFLSALCSSPDGQTLLQPDFLAFERREDGAVRVTLTLEGNYTLRLRRDYAPDRVLSLYSHDLPTLALWPSLPDPAGLWKTYFVFAHLPDPYRIRFCAGEDRTMEPLEGSSPRFVSRLSAYPVCFSLEKGEESAGSLPNLLPLPLRSEAPGLCACVDFGSSAVSVVLTDGRRRRPLGGSSMIRVLLSNPLSAPEKLRREFLSAVQLSSVFPTALRRFRPAPARDPFTDAVLLPDLSSADLSSLPEDALFASFKWEDPGDSAEPALHQIMLLTAQQAWVSGAASLCWRAAVPDEMALAGRERLLRLFQKLALTVQAESGIPFPEDAPPVALASESTALGAYFRYCSPDHTRGGFMTLDLGSSTADISLFLRGRTQAVRTCQLPLGMHYMLLPALLRTPELLSADFGFVPDPVFAARLEELRLLLARCAADPSLLSRVRLLLDALVRDYADLLLSAACQRLAGGSPARSGALLLLHFSFLLMLCGLILLQVSADPGRNESLPGQMTLFLAGRGSGLIEKLSDQHKNGLWHFLTMFRNRRVASLALMFSSEKKLEIPVGLSLCEDPSEGLPPAPAVPAAIAVRPEELLPEFLIRFRAEFPLEAALLFPGVYSNDPVRPFTPYGQSLIASATEHAFHSDDLPRPYDSLAVWLSTLLEMVSGR